MCLGIAHVSGKAPLSGQGKRADTQCICPFRPINSLGQKGQIHCVSAKPLVPGEGLYQIHGQSLNTHRGINTGLGVPNTFLIQKYFKTVTVTVILGKINSDDFQDGNWESMEMKG